MLREQRDALAPRPVMVQERVERVQPLDSFFFTDMGAPSLLRNTGTPGMMGLLAGAVVHGLVWSGG